jgi:hypothetical protein
MSFFRLVSIMQMFTEDIIIFSNYQALFNYKWNTICILNTMFWSNYFLFESWFNLLYVGTTLTNYRSKQKTHQDKNTGQKEKHV